MIVGKTFLRALARKQHASNFPLFCHNRDLVQANQHAVNLMTLRLVSSHRVTRNIEFITQENGNNSVKSIEQMNAVENRPLLVILSWLLSKRKHVMKFANLYMEQGFDVAMVSLTPWQLMWPVKGSRPVAADLLSFLMQNERYQQILIHGFSVGGYMWGEVLDLMQNDRKKYDPLIDRIIGQVWDSVADVTELSIGTPKAVFPKNVVLQSMLQKYLEYHMNTFYKQSTQYYIRASQLFHTTIVRAPALIFISKTDPVGTLSSNMRARDTWESLGMETYIKIFEKSPHVGHFRKYPKEYVGELYAFLNRLNLIQNEEKIMARL